MGRIFGRYRGGTRKADGEALAETALRSDVPDRASDTPGAEPARREQPNDVLTFGGERMETWLHPRHRNGRQDTIVARTRRLDTALTDPQGHDIVGNPRMFTVMQHDVRVRDRRKHSHPEAHALGHGLRDREGWSEAEYWLRRRRDARRAEQAHHEHQKPGEQPDDPRMHEAGGLSMTVLRRSSGHRTRAQGNRPATHRVTGLP